MSPIAYKISFDAESMLVRLIDGREIRIPLAWLPRLKNAQPAERENWRLIGHGVGIHFEDLDEDISVEALLR